MKTYYAIIAGGISGAVVTAFIYSQFISHKIDLLECGLGKVELRLVTE